tara:strand:+ start:644 stop:928 length:285 start_codon:yes stop_codon:yes gene_type:complete
MKDYTVQLTMTIASHDMGHKATRARKVLGKRQVRVVVSMTRAERNRLGNGDQQLRMRAKAEEFVKYMDTTDRIFVLNGANHQEGKFTTTVMEML